MAAIGLKFDIVVYLAGKGAKGEKFAGSALARIESDDRRVL